MIEITKENTTYAQADFAVDSLTIVEGTLLLALFFIIAIAFIMWEVKLIAIRLFIFLVLTTIGVHFARNKYKKVLQEHLKDIK